MCGAGAADRDGATDYDGRFPDQGGPTGQLAPQQREVGGGIRLPRAGLAPKVVRRICEAGPERIVYVSCNPTTFAGNLGGVQLGPNGVLINVARGTVVDEQALIEALRDGVILVIIILILFLMNVRTTFITLTAIPLSLVMTAVVFAASGMSINTMTLGGLAVGLSWGRRHSGGRRGRHRLRDDRRAHAPAALGHPRPGGGAGGPRTADPDERCEEQL